MLRYICSMDIGHFKKYSETLKSALEENDLRGADSGNVSKSDWGDFGVKVFRDRHRLHELMQQLLDANAPEDSNTQLMTSPM